MIRITIILLILIINIIIYNNIYIPVIIIFIYILLSYLINNMKENLIGYINKKEKEIEEKGYIIFIITELIIFLTFIGIYIYLSIRPSIEYDSLWIPRGIDNINLPIFNTILLLSSGIFMTLTNNNIKYIEYGINLVLIFILLQYIEYTQLSFDISSSLFGNIFYLLTRFSWITYDNSFIMIL